MSPQQTTPNNVQDSASGSTFVPWPRDGRTASNRSSGLQSNMNDDTSPQIASEHCSDHNLGGHSGNMDVVDSNLSTSSTPSFSPSSPGYSHVTWATVSTASSGEQLSLGTSSSSSSSSRTKQAPNTSGKSYKSSTNGRKRRRADEAEDVIPQNEIAEPSQSIHHQHNPPARGRPRTTTTNPSAKRRKVKAATAVTASQPPTEVSNTSAVVDIPPPRRGATRSAAGVRAENPYPVIPAVQPTVLAPSSTQVPVASCLVESGTGAGSSVLSWEPPSVAPSRVDTSTSSVDTQQARARGNPYPSLQLASVPVVGRADTSSSSAIAVRSQASSSSSGALDLQVASRSVYPMPIGHPLFAPAHGRHQTSTQPQAHNAPTTPPTTTNTPMASTSPDLFDPADLSGVPAENLVVFGHNAARMLAKYPGLRTRSVFSSADDMLQLHNEGPQVEPSHRPVRKAAPSKQVRRSEPGTAPEASLREHAGNDITTINPWQLTLPTASQSNSRPMTNTAVARPGTQSHATLSTLLNPITPNPAGSLYAYAVDFSEIRTQADGPN